MNPLKYIKIGGRFSVGLHDAYSVLSQRGAMSGVRSLGSKVHIPRHSLLFSNKRIKLPTHSPIYSIGINHGGSKKGMPDIRRRGTFI